MRGGRCAEMPGEEEVYWWRVIVYLVAELLIRDRCTFRFLFLSILLSFSLYFSLSIFISFSRYIYLARLKK